MDITTMKTFVQTEVKELLLDYAELVKRYIDSKDQKSIDILKDEIYKEIESLSDADKLKKTSEILDSVLKVFDTNQDGSLTIEEIDGLFSQIDNTSKAIDALLKELNNVKSKKDVLISYLQDVLSNIDEYKQDIDKAKELLNNSFNSMIERLEKLASVDYIRTAVKYDKDMIKASIRGVFYKLLYKGEDLLKLTTYPPGYAVLIKEKNSDYIEIKTTAVSDDQRAHGHFFEVALPYSNFKYVRFLLKNHGSGYYTKNTIQARTATNKVAYQVVSKNDGDHCEIPGYKWINVYFPLTPEIAKFKFIESWSAGIGVKEMEFLNYLPKDAKYVVKPTMLCTEWYV